MDPTNPTNPRHRQTDIVNAIYAAALQACEEREFTRGGRVGNGHHMAQEIATAAEEELIARGILSAREPHPEPSAESLAEMPEIDFSRARRRSRDKEKHLSVLVERRSDEKGDLWVAQCIEHELVAQSRSRADLERELLFRFNQHIEACRDRGIRPLYVALAPVEVRARFDAAPLQSHAWLATSGGWILKLAIRETPADLGPVVAAAVRQAVADVEAAHVNVPRGATVDALSWMPIHPEYPMIRVDEEFETGNRRLDMRTIDVLASFLGTHAEHKLWWTTVATRMLHRLIVELMVYRTLDAAGVFDEGPLKPGARPHPGDIVKDYVDSLGWNLAMLSRASGVDPVILDAVCNGKAPITDEIATALGMVLGRPAAFWMELQRLYDEASTG